MSKIKQTVEKVIHMLRHTQHERKNSNISKHSFVRLELVERWTESFSTVYAQTPMLIQHQLS